MLWLSNITIVVGGPPASVVLASCCRKAGLWLLPGRPGDPPTWWSPTHALAEISKSQWPFASLQTSIVLMGGNQPCCPLCIYRHLDSPGFQSPLDFGEKKLLGIFRLILQFTSIKEGTEQPHSTFSIVKWNCRRW